MKKFLVIFGGIFLTIGVLALAGGIYFKISMDSFKKTAKETTATITQIDSRRASDGDVSYIVTVTFTVDGQQYSGKLDYYSSSMYVGKTETIYYDPSNPNHFKASGSSFVVYIFMILGLVFTAIGGGVIFALIRKSKKRKRVLSYNYVIQANIVGFNVNTSMSVNGRHPYQLDATYINPLDGKLYNYSSEEVWADLTPILNSRQITTIPVYVNPNNLAEYYMDISGLTQFIGN